MPPKKGKMPAAFKKKAAKKAAKKGVNPFAAKSSKQANPAMAAGSPVPGRAKGKPAFLAKKKKAGKKKR